MKKKILSILTLLTFTASLSFAQSDAQSEEMLKSLSAKYKSYTSMKAEFSYMVDDPQAKSKETQLGTVSLKGDKYVLQIKGQEVISDGKTVWTYLKEANEVQVSEPEKNADAITPSNIFTMYEKGYDSKFIEEKTENGKQVTVIDIKPQDSKKNFFKVRLVIDKAQKQIVSSTVFNKNGSKATYTIKSFAPNTITSDALFTFDKAKHPGVEVVDLR